MTVDSTELVSTTLLAIGVIWYLEKTCRLFYLHHKQLSQLAQQQHQQQQMMTSSLKATSHGSSCTGSAGWSSSSSASAQQVTTSTYEEPLADSTIFARGMGASSLETPLKAMKYHLCFELMKILEVVYVCMDKPSLGARIARRLLPLSSANSVVHNISYGPHSRNRMDLHGVQLQARNQAQRVNKPVLLFIHGGAWAFGHKWQYRVLGEFLSQQENNPLVAVMNYRVYPDGLVNEMVHDVQNAVLWLADNVDQYGGNPADIRIVGHSAGSHLAILSLLRSAITHQSATKQRYQFHEDKNVCKHVKSVIALAGCYDIAEHYLFEQSRVAGGGLIQGVHEISPMKPAMQGVENFDTHSPTRVFQHFAGQIDFQLPPCTFVHGDSDRVVPLSSSRKLYDVMKQANQKVEFVEVEECGHEELVLALMGEDHHCQKVILEQIVRAA